MGAPMQGHRVGVRSIEFSEDNKFIVSVAKDGSVRCWDTIFSMPIREPLRCLLEGPGSNLKTTQSY